MVVSNIPQLSIIIVNFNASADLRACIASLTESFQYLHGEVIVIDNHSDDQLIIQRELRQYPFLKFIACTRNHGYATANNIGLRKARGKILLLLNPDTVIVNDAIKLLFDHLSTDEEMYVIGPQILDEDGRIDVNCGRTFPNIWTEALYHAKIDRMFPNSHFFGQYCMTYWDHKKSRNVDLLSGACMMFKREVLEKVGYMDERYFLYGDDVEWCYRCQKAGYKLFYYPHSQIIHKKGTSTKSYASTMRIMAIESMYKFFVFHRGTLHGLLYRILIFSIYGAKFLSRVLFMRSSYQVYRNMLFWTLGALKFDQDKDGQPKWRGSVPKER